MPNTGKKVLLIEDDIKVCSFINKGLSELGFEVTVALNGNQGLEWALGNKFSIIIIDIMLPDINGIEICKTIRNSKQQAPILFLTALGSVENIAHGLNSGADDYLVKPFKFIELTARINSLIRRSEDYEYKLDDDDIYKYADIEVNDSKKIAKRNGTELNLTLTEYKLLLLFLKNKERVISRNTILENVWGINFNLGTNVVDVYINYLRKKLERINPTRLIQTIIGMGYVLKESDENTK
ncbi:response regulator transcription factor [Mariniflexile sp.]|uniref:response regulator transcription factor n=1 Tax=Mariniflexile sp. TaxID=1979402 RepID=UPI0035612F99